VRGERREENTYTNMHTYTSIHGYNVDTASYHVLPVDHIHHALEALHDTPLLARPRTFDHIRIHFRLRAVPILHPCGMWYVVDMYVCMYVCIYIYV
jgi:hypothetical protein